MSSISHPGGVAAAFLAERQRLPTVIAIERNAMARIDENQLHANAGMTDSDRPTSANVVTARSISASLWAAE